MTPLGTTPATGKDAHAQALYFIRLMRLHEPFPPGGYIHQEWEHGHLALYAVGDDKPWQKRAEEYAPFAWEHVTGKSRKRERAR